MHDALARLDAMTAAPLVALAIALAGAVLGAFFYGGLWWTAQRAATFRRPGLSVLGSLLLRMGVALGGFWLVAGTDWARWLLCLVGFVSARVTVTWIARLPEQPSVNSRRLPGTRHAP
jgi:F1F0 ATPase subunit 2